jgi:Flp pilus assembly pilin Flp
MRNLEYQRLAASLDRVREEDGQDMAEYVVLVSLIAMVVLAAAIFLGHTIAGLFDQVIGVL